MTPLEASEFTRAYHSSLGRMRILGGAPALDLANTLHWRDGALADFIPDFESLTHWCVPAGLLNEKEADAVLQQARKHKVKAAVVHGKVLLLRDALKTWLVVSATNLNKGVAPKIADVRAIKSAIILAAGSESLGGILWLPPKRQIEALNLPLLRCVVAISALMLFPIDGDIRQCEADQCGGFFINQSRSKPRRWCSMDGCGNRAKATRFRQAQSRLPSIV